MQKFSGFQMPSAQEQEAKVAHWKGKLVDRYLKDERDARLKPQPPADSKKQHEAANDKSETATQQPQDSATKDTVEKEPWLYEENGTKMVQASLIPGSVRSIWPGTPVTRDLRFDRMNIMCDKNGLITNVSFG
ncbi:hypothetical protein COEREDRAFT_83774 [Coemansia reversa NRRL 1564]|uniref:Proteinase inhibitor I78 n=1 Tax=Coemansia reversa (strain ATCC 12441 / NRRL 1564) TaxID=763665 RepID=A0A2G5B1Y8_COERN|nr:hypothetical protein COEREDRAFT_83774 [Coemansia reversa NRRL 1564]|eukprot:PIA13016.1 hypothetical protein COEREDRAFT_83774 [Coemansia reversa NRRL 1564]